MNIFVLDENPFKAAQLLFKDDIYMKNKRSKKMILESAQLLSTALNEYNSGLPVYKTTHKNHPCAIWVRQSRQNYTWLLMHMKGLNHQFRRLTGKNHASYEKLYLTFLHGMRYIPNRPSNGFVNCAANDSLGLNYKHIDNVCLAYKTYLEKRKELYEGSK